MTAETPPGRGRRGVRACADRVRAAWWALSGRDRIAARGLLLAGALLAAAWRAGHIGLVQADFVLSVLGGTAAVATLCRGAVYRPRPAAPAAGPLVAPSEEVQRHAAGEAGTGPGPDRENCEGGTRMVMTGRQRRAGGSVLAATGWWAQWSGYESGAWS
ncbi:hypothetical protein ACWDYJ_23805 [Streptomyces sp. NPDC003042]